MAMAAMPHVQNPTGLNHSPTVNAAGVAGRQRRPVQTRQHRFAGCRVPGCELQCPAGNCPRYDVHSRCLLGKRLTFAGNKLHLRLCTIGSENFNLRGRPAPLHRQFRPRLQRLRIAELLIQQFHNARGFGYAGLSLRDQ